LNDEATSASPLKSESALKSIGLGRSREPDRSSQLQHHTSNGGFGSISQAPGRHSRMTLNRLNKFSSVHLLTGPQTNFYRGPNSGTQEVG